MLELTSGSMQPIAVLCVRSSWVYFAAVAAGYACKPKQRL